MSNKIKPDCFGLHKGSIKCRPCEFLKDCKKATALGEVQEEKVDLRGLKSANTKLKNKVAELEKENADRKETEESMAEELYKLIGENEELKKQIKESKE